MIITYTKIKETKLSMLAALLYSYERTLPPTEVVSWR